MHFTGIMNRSQFVLPVAKLNLSFKPIKMLTAKLFPIQMWTLSQVTIQIQSLLLELCLYCFSYQLKLRQTLRLMVSWHSMLNQKLALKMVKIHLLSFSFKVNLPTT